MAFEFSQPAIASLKITANAAARYLDFCDCAPDHARLDAEYYQLCARLLVVIFSLAKPVSYFLELLTTSQAARELAESVEIERRLHISRMGYYPELSSILLKAAAA